MPEPKGRVELWKNGGQESAGRESVGDKIIRDLAAERRGQLAELKDAGIKRLGSALLEAFQAAHRAETLAHSGTPEAGVPEQPQAAGTKPL